MRTTTRSPATSDRKVSPAHPPASGVRSPTSMPATMPGPSSLAGVEDHLPQRVRVERRSGDEEESRRSNGPDWDRYADEYQATHGDFLGNTGFVWGPEGLPEDEAGVLGDVTGRDVLEVGSGAGQCSRWVRVHGGTSYGLDLSARQLQHSRRIDDETADTVLSERA